MVFVLFIFGSAGSFWLLGNYSLVAVQRPLVVVASLVSEHGLQDKRASEVSAHGLSSCGSHALELRLNSCCAWA